MGCDITSFAEVKQGSQWKPVGDVFSLDEWGRKVRRKEFCNSPFNWRDYGMYGFLANVRNYSRVPTVTTPRSGIPHDVSPEVRSQFDSCASYVHTPTWVTLRELLEFDYEQIFWNRYVRRQVTESGYSVGLAEEGEGVRLSVRDFLGPRFFEHLNVLKALGAPEDVRIIFWFID
jgi:hypothetical protein